MRDVDVRRALHREVLRRHSQDPDTLVVHELGLCNGSARVDVAVVNGSLHGYEIKSDSDTLERLPGQIAVYGAVLDKVTLVVGQRHLDKASAIIPDWWAVKVAREGTRGGVTLKEARGSKINPSVDPVAVAELLWHSEAAAALEALGAPRNSLRRARRYLHKELAEMMPADSLRELVRESLKRRENWRCRLGPVQNVGCLTPIPRC